MKGEYLAVGDTSPTLIQALPSFMCEAIHHLGENERSLSRPSFMSICTRLGTRRHSKIAPSINHRSQLITCKSQRSSIVSEAIIFTSFPPWFIEMRRTLLTCNGAWECDRPACTACSIHAASSTSGWNSLAARSPHKPSVKTAQSRADQSLTGEMDRYIHSQNHIRSSKDPLYGSLCMNMNE